MVSHIVVPLDGSGVAERALPYAEQLARKSTARMTLVSAAPHVNTLLPGGELYNRRSKAELREYLDRETARLREAGLQADSILAEADPVDAIVNGIESAGADLAVMSTHGRSGLPRFAWGSVTEGVLRRSRKPVLVIPREVALDWTVQRSPRILVALDGSAFGEQAIAPAQDLAAALGAELVLLRAVDPTAWISAAGDPWAVGQPYISDLHEQEASAATRYLEEVKRRLGPTVRTILVHETPASAIVRVAREQRVMAVAMATHSRGGAERVIFGSVADAVLRASPVPLLVVRPTDQSAADTVETSAGAERAAVSVTLTRSEVAATRRALECSLEAEPAQDDLLSVLGKLDVSEATGYGPA